MSIKHSGTRLIAAVLLLSCFSPIAVAAVTAEEAARLHGDLTPFGAEKAGNKEGTIPAWDGGYTQVWPGYQSGQPRPDPFANEKPLFQITARNMDQHADKLSDGVKALLKRFPTYRIDVYPTHRTAAAPQWVYDNTFKNATRAKSDRNGLMIEGAYGGIPFPIPKSGAEAMRNHLLEWRGEAAFYDFSNYIIAHGKPTLATAGRVNWQYPYYFRDGSLNRFKGIFELGKETTTAPPFKVGENILLQDPLNGERKAWQYLVGQRRVRRAPSIAYDTPDTLTSGFNFFDEGYLFNGPMDRYDWKLVGKKEMFVPYNTNGFHTKKIDQVLGPDHLNPDYLRWELHRVWIVEATLAPGKRHVLPRRRFYLDEDSWLALLSEGWDAQGQLWHVGTALPVIVPELPGLVTIPFITYDLLKGGYVAESLLNEIPRHHYQTIRRQPEEAFSPEALGGEGIR